MPPNLVDVFDEFGRDRFGIAPRWVDMHDRRAWAPPDHPTARWEAKVIAVRARKAKVRFLGFDASWDTWLPHDSDELFPARAGIPSNPST